MKNKIFQFVYYKIIEKIISVDKSLSGIARQYSRMHAQLILSKIFGGAKLVLIGDSNSAVFSEYQHMKNFRKLTLAFGVGGTTVEHWVDFFRTKEGVKFYSAIKNKKIIWNIGGNNVLLGRMQNIDGRLSILRNLFSFSYNCLVPPIWIKLIAQLYNDEEVAVQLTQDIDTINDYIKKIWGDHTIDWNINDFMRIAKIMVFRDLVHYSEYVLPFMVQCLNVLIWGL